MKRWIYIFLLFPYQAFADSVTPGNVGLLLPSLGVVDKTRSWGDKINSNFSIIASTLGKIASNSTPSIQNPATGYFNMNSNGAITNSTGIGTGFIEDMGSATIRGIIISTSGFQVGGSTIQGIFLLEGSTIQVRNGTNEFSIVFATSMNAGNHLFVADKTGSRLLIAGGGDSAGSGSGGSGNLFIEPHSVSISTIFLPRSDFDARNGTGISTFTWRGSTGTITAPQLWQSSATFQGFVKISSLTSFEGFGIAQSSGLEVGGVQFTIYMPTITTAIDFLKVQNSSSDSQQEKFVNFRTTTDALSRPSLQNPATGFFNMNQFGISNSSAFMGGQSIFEGSGTWKGIIVSSAGGLFGGTTVQGRLVIEGGSITILSAGTNQFTVVFASQPSVGQKLGITQSVGERVIIGGVGDLDTTSDSGDPFGNPASTRVISAPFGIDSSSGIFFTSATAYSGFTSTTGFIGASSSITFMSASTMTVTSSATFNVVTVSSFNITGGTFVWNNNTMVLASTPIPTSDQVMHLKNGIAYFGGDNAGSGGGSGVDSFGNPSSTMVIVAPFGINTSSGVIFSSINVMGIYTSTTGFQVAASTVSGIFMLEGGTIQFRNGTNEFSVAFDSGGYSVGDRLIVSQVSGSRFVIASGKPSIESSSGGGGGAVASFNGTTTASFSTMSIITPYEIASVSNGSSFSTFTVLGATNPYRTISIPAAAWLGVAPASASWQNGGFSMTSTNTAYNIPGEVFHLFSDPTSTRTFVTTTFRMPFEWDGSSIGFTVSWFASTGPASKNVGWSLSAVAISSGSSIFVSDVSSATTFSTFVSSNNEILSSMSPAYNIQNVPAPGSRVKFYLTAFGGGFTGLPKMTEVLISFRQKFYDGILR